MTTYTVTALLADVPFSAEGLMRNTIFGAVSGAVSFGVGELFEGVKSTILIITAQSAIYGVSQGAITAVQGGDFWSSFASAAVSSLLSSGFVKWGGNFAGSQGSMIAFSTVSGGAVAELTGGNFWQGAATAFFVSALNHAAHKMNEGGDGNGDKKRSLTKKERQLIGDNYPDYNNYPDATSVYKEVGGMLYKEYLKDPNKYINTCAVRLSVAFEKSNIDIGGEYYGEKGLKYYTSATNLAKALEGRFLSFSKGLDMSQYGIAVQYVSSKYEGKVYHVDVVFLKNGKGVFGNTLYGGYYNKYY